MDSRMLNHVTHIFRRYIRSDHFSNFLESNEQVLKLISIDLSTTSPRNAVRFQPRDLIGFTISDKDIQFVLRLNSDTSDWQQVYQGPDNWSGFVSRTNYSIGGLNSLKLAKIVGFLPCSAEEAIAMDQLDETRHMFDGNQREQHYICTIKAGDNNDNPYSYTLYNYALEIGTLFRRRNFALVNTIVYDTERMCYANIGKSASCFTELTQQHHKKKHYVQSEMIFGFSYYRISESL